MDRCSFCLRLIPRRPGTLSMPVSHVCADFQGMPMPYGIAREGVGPITHAALAEQDASLEEQLAEL